MGKRAPSWSGHRPGQSASENVDWPRRGSDRPKIAADTKPRGAHATVHPQLIVGAEVIDAVGVQKAAAFQAEVTVFECVECSTPGDVRQEPAARRETYGGNPRSWCCAPPPVSPSSASRTTGAASHVCEYAPGTLTMGDMDLIPRAVGVPGPRGLRPVLLLAYEAGFTLPSSPDPEADPLVQLLLDDGLHPLTALGRTAPASADWQVVTGPGTAPEVRTPGGSCCATVTCSSRPSGQTWQRGTGK